MANKKRKNKNTLGYKRFCQILFITFLILSILLIYKVASMDILNSNLFVTACIILLAIDVIIFITSSKSTKVLVKFLSILLGLALASGKFFVLYNINITESFISSIATSTAKKEIYNIYVLNTSDISNTKDLKEKRIGIFNNGSEYLSEALADFKRKVDTFLKSENYYNDLEEILLSGINKSEDALLIPSAMDQIIDEEYCELKENFKILDNIIVTKSEKVKKSNVDILKDPFIIYISGIDTYGSIGTVSRSDVNILVLINPKTNKILLVNTPRDYYVKLHSKNSYDKLTHAGIYGLEESLTTLEDLYEVDIPFYLKVNFTSLINVVDAIGNIKVESKYAFSYDGYSFNKGKNVLNGKQALAFSRYRKGLPNGDISRGENQEAVIEAIIDKITNPNVITKYASILNSLRDSFVTNMDKSDIYKLAKHQINSSPNWQITTKNAIGTDAYNTTYSTGKTKLYVMVPSEESLISVKSSIKSVLN